MLFRLSYIIKSFNLGKEDSLYLKVNHQSKEISILFEKIPLDKKRPEYQPGDLLVHSIVEIPLSQKRKAQFAEIKSPLSNSIQEFIRPINLELSDCILNTIKILRWRFRNESYSNPIRYWFGFSYSNDGSSWKSFPDQITMAIFFDLPQKVCAACPQYRRHLQQLQ